jgi:hypothetical protein
MEVVGDVNRMSEAFGRGVSPDDLMSASWSDLKALRCVLCLSFSVDFDNGLRSRDIVNDVCKWAYDTTV